MDLDRQAFILNRTKLQAGESLAPDPSAYEMLHTLGTRWPCLSFDILPDDLGDNRQTYPATVFAVAGTQAEGKRTKDNELLVMHLSNLTRMKKGPSDSDSDSSDEEEENVGNEPLLDTKSIPLPCTTNRIRARQFPSANASKPPTTLTATMLENATLQIHNITPHLRHFNSAPQLVGPSPITPQQNKPLTTLRMHKSEGYALAWSPLIPTGKLLSGDNDGKIYLTTASDDFTKFTADARPFIGHASSVEDIQWSPSEKSVFASASSDGTVKVWDTRSKSRTPALSVQVSDTDVNVLSWSKLTPWLLATGADSGEWAVWNLKHWKDPSFASSSSTDPASSSAAGKPKPIANFSFHKEQITSVEWHPTDDSIVLVAAGDNTLTLWDLSVEFDDEESKDTAGVRDFPPQLLFVHYMEQVKEGHWCPQQPGQVMATGEGGFGVFKTISM